MKELRENSILLVDKPAGITSFGVVARIRRKLSEKVRAVEKTPMGQKPRRIKVGHTGTLDPFATGLMILVTGKECQNAGNYSKLDKTYEATVCLGAISSTANRRERNVQLKKDIKLAVKAFMANPTAETLSAAQGAYDTGVKKNLYSKATAARRKSALHKFAKDSGVKLTAAKKAPAKTPAKAAPKAAAKPAAKAEAKPASAKKAPAKATAAKKPATKTAAAKKPAAK